MIFKINYDTLLGSNTVRKRSEPQGACFFRFGEKIGGWTLAEKGRKNTAQVAADLALPVAEEMGLELWDVRYEKEGTEWFLRYYVDRDGLDLNTVEAFSRRMSDILDEADPISGSYTLEVSSPGIERRLSTEEHVRKYLGYLANVTFIRAPEGYSQREFLLELDSLEDGVITASFEDGTELRFTLKQTAKITLYYDYSQDGSDAGITEDD